MLAWSNIHLQDLRPQEKKVFFTTTSSFHVYHGCSVCELLARHDVGDGKVLPTD